MRKWLKVENKVDKREKQRELEQELKTLSERKEAMHVIGKISPHIPKQ